MALSLRHLRLVRQFATFSFMPGSPLIKATSEAIEVLKALPPLTVNECIKVFVQNVFPPENRSSIPSKLEPILENSPNSYEMFAIAKRDHKDKETIVQEALETIYEFLDKTDIGFLSGDISFHSIQIVLRYSKAFKYNLSVHIAELVEEMTNHIRKENFCLPKNGIRYLEYENPKALYKREIMIEKETPLIHFDTADTSDQTTSDSITYKCISSKKMLSKLHLDLAKLIKRDMKEIVGVVSESSEILADHESVTLT